MLVSSTWWIERERIHVRTSIGGSEIVVVPVSVDRLLARDDVVAREIARLLDSGDRDTDGLQYVLLGKVGRADRCDVGPHLEIRLLQALDRALAEHVDLRERHFGVRAHQGFHGDLDLLAQLLDQEGGELVQLPAGVVLVHRAISFEHRLMLRARAAGRARLVNDLLASRRRAAAEARAA